MITNGELLKDKIRVYIHEAVHVNDEKICDDSLIFKEGYLDSMGFIMLLSYLEDEFGISTCDADLVEENFESINAISLFVSSKSGH